jgi:EAL domain-containing protein (putative c-di-GMP-specific phosphodiesterase class I)
MLQAADAVLFVNLHPRDLADEALFAAASPLARIAHSVILEITERASLDEVSDVRDRVARLRQLGFRLAVDDLGAGYAGLTSFATLEPDVIKLDMSLVRDVDTNLVKRRVVERMTALAHELGVLVVAEGVETVAERGALVATGCDLLQGYLLARPGRPFPSVAWPA